MLSKAIALRVKLPWFGNVVRTFFSAKRLSLSSTSIASGSSRIRRLCFVQFLLVSLRTSVELHFIFAKTSGIGFDIAII